MWWLIAKRVLRLVGVLWVVSLLSFSMVDLIPGDPVSNIYGETATPEQIATARAELGLDQSFVHRYLDWLHGAVTFDFGNTLVPPVSSVSSVVGHALPVTLQLALMAVIISLAVGLPLGALAAYYEGSVLDRIIGGSTFGMLSIPSFVMALLLILLFVFNIETAKVLLLAIGVALTVAILVRRLRSRGVAAVLRDWKTLVPALLPLVVGLLCFAFLKSFPRQGWVTPGESLTGNLRSAILPAVTMAAGVIPLYAQLLRSDMQATLKQNFIAVARAKGETPSQIVLREALRPSLFSLVTVAALSFGTLLAGSVIVESIFNLPGLGRMVVSAIVKSDYVLVQTGVLVAASIFVILNTLVDVTYAFLDPRIRRASN